MMKGIVVYYDYFLFEITISSKSIHSAYCE